MDPRDANGPAVEPSARAGLAQSNAAAPPASGPSRPLVAAVAVAAGLGGLALLLARGAARNDEQIAYAPTDVPKPLADDVWIVDSGPLSAMGIKVPIRMTVVRLRDGALLLHSPTRYTPDLGRALEALGIVAHLVAPTMAHWMFLADWQRAYPKAKTWGVPVLRHRAQVRRSGVRIDADLADAPPAAWADEIAQGLVTGGGGFQEAWFFHKRSSTLLLADLVENLRPSRLPPATALVMRALGATRATTGLHVRAALALRSRETREAIAAMLATEPKQVVFAHGDTFMENGAEQLRSAFRWITRSPTADQRSSR